jgi:glycosyltransferase involved in cell wall biosynthesis
MTDHRPHVSVVINFLNGEKFIQEAIDSVLAQTYGDWELLLVDDGSTDGSTEIARACVSRFPEKVTYLEHEGHQNKGSGASRNLGIRKARGEYIAFLDADDAWFPQKLQKQTEILDAAPEAAMVVGPARVWCSWSEQPSPAKDYDSVAPYAADRIVEPPEVLRAQLENERDAPFPSGMLIRRAVAEEVGGFEEEFRGKFMVVDDQVFCAKVCLRYPVFALREPVFKYRIHPDSLCQTSLARGEHSRARQRFLEWLEAYLDGRVERDSAVWRELQRQLRPYRRPLLHRAIQLKTGAARNAVRLAVATARLVLPAAAYNWMRERFRRAES